MPILNYTTKVNASKTVGEIYELLNKNGARKITIDNDETGKPQAITFSIMHNNLPIYFELTINFEGVLKAMQRDPQISQRFCTMAHAYNVGWRIEKENLEVQLAKYQAGLATITEIFFPYLIVGEKTLHRHFIDNPQKLLNK